MRAAVARLGANPWPVLAIAMAVAAVVILEAGRGTSFSGDELFYFGRQADNASVPVDYSSFSLEYVLAPHNSHLQPAGKLVYEAMFALFGADYTPFRVLELFLVLLSIGLFFELARARAGAPAALLLAILLCFLGAAWEVLLWPFDLHTAGALASGLAALLVLERAGRRADPLACGLLILSISFVELGVAFLAAVAVSVLMRSDRWRRIWIVALPAALYIAWYVWAQRFELTPVGAENLPDVIPAWFDSLRTVAVSLTGTFHTGGTTPVPVVGPATMGTVLAVAVVAAVAVRLRRGSLPGTLWPLLTALLVYWTFIGLAERSADSSRYVLAGAMLALLVATELLRDRRAGPVAIAIVAVLVALALPKNLAKLGDGGDYLAQDADLTRGEFAMVELAGDHATPGLLPGRDRAIRRVGGSPYILMDGATYAGAARRIGSLADPVDRIRGEDITLRNVDDVVLARLLGLRVEPSGSPPAGSGACRQSSGEGVAALPPRGVYVRPLAGDTSLHLGRFVPDLPVVDVGTAPGGGWSRLALPGPDPAPDPWMLFFDGPVRVCAIGA